MKVNLNSDATRATVLLESGDYLGVGYVDPDGVEHTINISPSSFVVMVEHERSKSFLMIRQNAVQVLPK